MNIMSGVSAAGASGFNPAAATGGGFAAWGGIISGIISAAASITSAGIQSSYARKAGELQIRATELANKQARADWREQMRIEEEERKKNDLRSSMALFQGTINANEMFKNQVRNAWSGRRAT